LINLTLAQRQLIRRVERFMDSRFDSLVAPKYYLVSPSDYIEWINIPSASVQHLSKIRVTCFSGNRSVSASSVERLQDSVDSARGIFS